MSGELSLSDVTAGYGEGSVLKGISLTANSGEVTGLIGRNGVGKTTTLRAIMGKIPIKSGTIRFNGEDITHLSPTECYRLRMGMVQEDRGIFPDLTVEENLSVPVLYDEPNSWLIEELYEFFPKLKQLQDSKGKNLSGGEQQMLALARAIRPNPKVLLLDEPTEGLAPQIVEDVYEVIKRLAERSMTILLVEQNIEMTLRLASNNYILENGQIVVEGTSEELREGDDISQHLSVGVAGD